MISSERLKITIYLVAIFLIGGVAGGFVALAWKGRPGPPSIANVTERQMHRLTEELSLTEDQVERIRPILATISDEIRAVRRESMAEFARIYGEMVTQVEAELTPEQATLFRIREEERRQRADGMLNRRHQEFMDRKGPGTGPGPRDGGWRGGAGPPPKP